MKWEEIELDHDTPPASLDHGTDGKTKVTFRQRVASQTQFNHVVE